MRTAIATLGVVAAGLSIGACFDPTRPCSSSADCVNGGSCDPATKTCVSGGNPNDKVPPVFSIVVAPPPARQNTTKLTELDPGSPDGGAGAFRRDESVTVTVSSNDQDVDAGSVRLVVSGVSGNPGTALAPPLGPCTPGSLAAGAPFCRQVTVSLAQLPFEAFRAVVPLEVSGADLSNNLGKADAGVNVTRWKWRYSAGAPIYTTPAIADDGTVVFGTSDGGSGSLYALTPAGTERWTPAALGAIQASPVVGSGSAATSLVYAATAGDTGSKIYAVNLSDGADAGVCASSTGAGFLAGLALVQTVSDSGPLESAVGVSGTSRLYTLRPKARPPSDSACIEAFVTVQQVVTETIAGDASALFVGAADNTARSFTFDETSRNWVKNPGWPSGTALLGAGELGPIAIVGGDLLASVRPDGLCKIAKTTGAVTCLGPDGGIKTDPSGPVAALSQVFFSDTDLNAPRIWSLDPVSRASSGSIIAGAARSVPVLGSGGRLYIATNGGLLEARSNGATSWSTQLATEQVTASPTLDCLRDAGLAVKSPLGVIYVGTTAGNLFAVLVDSPGLDPTAPWPKYQHDVRNTGNPTTPIQPCP